MGDEEPLCICLKGQLYMQDAGAYEPIDRFRAVLMREHFLERAEESRKWSGIPSPLSADYAQQLQDAIEQYDAHHREKV